MIKFFSDECSFNIYIYAPKDDPFHRERWMEPYPDDQLKKTKRTHRRLQEAWHRILFRHQPWPFPAIFKR
ncbi:MAG: beta-N-acetylglucosaminidase domain-containing protein [Thermoproteota archaeon]